jgi:hypothetical protein
MQNRGLHLTDQQNETNTMPFLYHHQAASLPQNQICKKICDAASRIWNLPSTYDRDDDDNGKTNDLAIFLFLLKTFKIFLFLGIGLNTKKFPANKICN